MKSPLKLAPGGLDAMQAENSAYERATSSSVETAAAKSWHTFQFRCLSIIPFAIFIWRLVQYIQVHTPDWIMYSCHISTLALGVAMLFGWPLLIRTTVIWLVIGLPMWLIDAYFTHVVWIASVFSHLGGFILAIYVINRVRATGRSWLPALVWFLCLQMITRYTTAPELNINVAHSPYEAYRSFFGSYWTFWPVCTVAVALMVLGVEFCLKKAYPMVRQEGTV